MLIENEGQDDGLVSGSEQIEVGGNAFAPAIRSSLASTTARSTSTTASVGRLRR